MKKDDGLKIDDELLRKLRKEGLPSLAKLLKMTSKYAIGKKEKS